jgi:hypothetical protein
MGSVNLAVSLVIGLVAAGVLTGIVPTWIYSIALVAALVIVSANLYRHRHVVLGGDLAG